MLTKAKLEYASKRLINDLKEQSTTNIDGVKMLSLDNVETIEKISDLLECIVIMRDVIELSRAKINSLEVEVEYLRDK